MVIRRATLAVMATVAVMSTARAQSRTSDEQAALLLVRYTLVALDQANKSGNYGVLRDLGAPEFRSANTTARLASIFSKHRRAGLDLAAAAVLEPAWRLPPGRDAQGVLHLSGAYPSARVTTQFDLAFKPNGAGWQLTNLSVSLSPSQENASLLEGVALRR